MPGEDNNGLKSRIGGINRDADIARQSKMEQHRMDNPGMRRTPETSISSGNVAQNSSAVNTIARSRANHVVNNKVGVSKSGGADRLKRKVASTYLKSVGVPKQVSDKLVESETADKIMNLAKRRSFLGLLKSSLGNFFSDMKSADQKKAEEDADQDRIENVSVRIPKPLIKWFIIGACSMFLPLLVVLIPGAYVYNEIAGDSAIDDATVDSKMNDGDSSWWEEQLAKQAVD